MKGKIKSSIIVALICLLVIFDNIIYVKSMDVELNNERFSGYAAISSVQSTNETVTYTSKETSYIEIPYGVPIYRPIAELTNSCGATGGAIVIGYYDKYYEDLIPNYKSYLSSGKYKGNDSVYVPNLMRELYVLMRTNVDDVGVSKSDCISGLTNYIQNKGHTVTYTDIGKSNTISETGYINAINNNCPTLLFCNRMDLYTFDIVSGADNLSVYSVVGGHVAVAYGLYTVKYYNGTNNFRTDKYLQVATGLSERPSGYVNIDSSGWLNYAYSVSIN